MYDLHSCFKSGQEMLEDEPHGGRPTTSVNAEANSEVKELVHVDWQITISKVANEVGVDQHNEKKTAMKMAQWLAPAPQQVTQLW